LVFDDMGTLVTNEAKNGKINLFGAGTELGAVDPVPPPSCVHEFYKYSKIQKEKFAAALQVTIEL